MTKTIRGDRHKLLIRLLIEKRKKANMTQTDLAKLLSVYQSHIARLESGERRIDVIEYLEIAEVIGFDPYEMLKEVSKIPD